VEQVRHPNRQLTTAASLISLILTSWLKQTLPLKRWQMQQRVAFTPAKYWHSADSSNAMENPYFFPNASIEALA
jgi:hypothetical protein